MLDASFRLCSQKAQYQPPAKRVGIELKSTSSFRTEVEWGMFELPNENKKEAALWLIVVHAKNEYAAPLERTMPLRGFYRIFTSSLQSDTRS